MSRGTAAVEGAIEGAHAWAYMRRDPDYRKAWAAHGAPPRFEAAPFPLRVQSEGDLEAAAAWSLLAWDDPEAEAWRSPFWSDVAMLVGEPDRDPDPDPTPLLSLLAEAGARVEGLRLTDGRFILKVELGNAALQILVPSGRPFAPGDGIMAKLGLSLPLEMIVERIEDLWRVSGGQPPRQGRVRGANTRNS